MPSKKRKNRPLQVRRYLRLQEPSRTEVLYQNKWQPCDSLERAREIARKRGYAGITITPI